MNKELRKTNSVRSHSRLIVNARRIGSHEAWNKVYESAKTVWQQAEEEILQSVLKPQEARCANTGSVEHCESKKPTKNQRCALCKHTGSL